MPRRWLYAAEPMPTSVSPSAPVRAEWEEAEEFIAGSFIAKPSGEIVAKAVTDGDELVIASLDMEEVEYVRRRIDLEKDRRPEVYSRIIEG